MTIDEAIQILNELKNCAGEAGPTKDEDALKLGIEALREIKRLRSYKTFHVLKTLPGETQE